jgi:hypothetical protein
MQSKIKDKLIGIASLLFMFFNASTFGSTKEPFFLFGTIIGLMVSVYFFNTDNK